MQWLWIGVVLPGAIMTVIIVMDAVFHFREWFGRIHIGRYPDIQQWERSMIDQGIRWLNRTPKVKVTDQTRLVLIDMLRGHYTKPALQQWQEASLVSGIYEYTQGDQHPLAQQARQQLTKYVSTRLKKNGEWNHAPSHIDSAILAYALLKLKRRESNVQFVKPACDQMWQVIQDHLGSDGTVMYRKSMPEYRYVDTIGFICPFLTAYGVTFGREDCIKLAIRQIKEYEKYGMFCNETLPSHAYHIVHHTPLGLYGWGRGIGWFAIGLMDTWHELPDQYPHKQELEESITSLAHTIAKYQHPHGYWSWTVTRKEARADSSATAILAWFMLNAAQITEHSTQCIESAERGMQYLMSVTRRSGAVDFSQGDTKDIGVYSTLFGVLPFTQGYSLRIARKFRQDVSSL